MNGDVIHEEWKLVGPKMWEAPQIMYPGFRQTHIGESRFLSSMARSPKPSTIIIYAHGIVQDFLPSCSKMFLNLSIKSFPERIFQ